MDRPLRLEFPGAIYHVTYSEKAGTIRAWKGLTLMLWKELLAGACIFPLRKVLKRGKFSDHRNVHQLQKCTQYFRQIYKLGDLFEKYASTKNQ